MPRGENPNSRANLKPVRSEKEARKKGKKGGKASGESRRALSSFREVYQRTATDDDLMIIMNKVMELAKRGNLNALDRLLKISGEDRESEADTDLVQEFLDKISEG